MACIVRCDLCGNQADAERRVDGTFALPLGWQTPRDDNDRAVYGRRKEVCSPYCQDELFQVFKERA